MTDLLQPLLEKITNVVPFFSTLVAVLLVLALARYVMQRRSAPVMGYNFRLQVVMLTLSVAGFILVVMALPIAPSTKGQLLSLFGILLSGAIALSATTFLGNIMAGLMQRAVRSFRSGDFIRVGEHFGRVTERGLFHVEIQSEDRDLTTMPNLYLATNPVRVIRSSGTLVSADISLGYDVPRKRVRQLLTEAAESAQLKEPFVLVQDLGDFSVTYRVAGLLKEVKSLLSTRSRLREMVLDSLHEAGIEIVSPNFMNQRVLTAGDMFIPKPVPAEVAAEPESEEKLEALAFDKAEKAESVERLREVHDELKQKLEETESKLKDTKDDSETSRLMANVEALKARMARLASVIADRAPEDD
jgi:small-conductance mechanosensitive channel